MLVQDCFTVDYESTGLWYVKHDSEKGAWKQLQELERAKKISRGFFFLSLSLRRLTDLSEELLEVYTTPVGDQMCAYLDSSLSRLGGARTSWDRNQVGHMTDAVNTMT